MRPVLPALAVLAAALAGCLAAPAPVDPAGAPDAAVDAAMGAAPLAFTNATGTVLALPLVGGEARVPFEVPEGALWAGATLKWQTRGIVLALEGLDPDGTPRGKSASGGRAPLRADWWAAHPTPGPWTFVVRSDQAVDEAFTLQLHTVQDHVEGMHLAEVTPVREGRFTELNFEMKQGEALTYRWDSAEDLYFNIHVHRDGETRNLVEETTNALEGTLTATDDGGYSLFWEVPGSAPVGTSGKAVELRYRVDGQYAVVYNVG